MRLSRYTVQLECEDMHRGLCPCICTFDVVDENAEEADESAVREAWNLGLAVVRVDHTEHIAILEGDVAKTAAPLGRIYYEREDS